MSFAVYRRKTNVLHTLSRIFALPINILKIQIAINRLVFDEIQRSCMRLVYWDSRLSSIFVTCRIGPLHLCSWIALLAACHEKDSENVSYAALLQRSLIDLQSASTCVYLQCEIALPVEFHYRANWFGVRLGPFSVALYKYHLHVVTELGIAGDISALNSALALLVPRSFTS